MGFPFLQKVCPYDAFGKQTEERGKGTQLREGGHLLVFDWMRGCVCNAHHSRMPLSLSGETCPGPTICKPGPSLYETMAWLPDWVRLQLHLCCLRMACSLIKHGRHSVTHDPRRLLGGRGTMHGTGFPPRTCMSHPGCGFGGCWSGYAYTRWSTPSYACLLCRGACDHILHTPHWHHPSCQGMGSTMGTVLVSNDGQCHGQRWAMS